MSIALGPADSTGTLTNNDAKNDCQGDYNCACGDVCIRPPGQGRRNFGSTLSH